MAGNLLDLKSLLAWVYPDVEECRREAEKLRLADPGASAEQAARRAVKEARRWGASVGAATGVAASPITMLPAALADAAAMLRIEGKLAGVIAALLDPDSLNSPGDFEKDILRTVFPGAVSQALRKLGVRAGEQATKNLMRKLVGREAGKELGERAIKFLGIRLSEKAVASKTVPVVGAGIGAAWNWLEVAAVGKRAIDYHMGREPAERRAARKVVKFVRRQATQRLRKRRR
jgi:hypothetical protein